jgi:MarR-like DNA-binding transcriptional regulator SgrR of sgrS sRNA
MLVLTAASTAMSVNAQQEQASAQEAANRRQYENSMKAMAANVNQTNAEHMQQREAAMQKLDENNMQARAARSTAQVSAGENGISGMSVDALLSDLGNRQQRFNSAVTTNYQNAEMAINNQRENIGIDTASQINSLKTPAMPDYAGAALRIGTAAYDYYNPRISDKRVR